MSGVYKIDHRGMGKMLRSEFMQEAMLRHGEMIKLRAIVLAPVGHPPESKHPGRYKASFHVKVHARGGATHDRAEAVVYNDSPEALYVEYAHWGEEPYHILARAAFGGPHRR